MIGTIDSTLGNLKFNANIQRKTQLDDVYTTYSHWVNIAPMGAKISSCDCEQISAMTMACGTPKPDPSQQNLIL